MAEPPGPGEDFAAWSAARWASISPDVDPTAALVAIRFIRTAKELTQSHARLIAPWKNRGVATIDDFRTLGLLRHIGGRGLRLQHIAEHLDADEGTISSRLARLEKHGLVERFDDPADRGARLVRLVPEHDGLVEDIYRALVENHAHFFSSCPPPNIDVFSNCSAWSEPSRPRAGFGLHSGVLRRNHISELLATLEWRGVTSFH